MAQITIIASNPIDEMERTRILQSMSDNLTTEELQKLDELSNSEKARNMLNKNWNTLKTFI